VLDIAPVEPENPHFLNLGVKNYKNYQTTHR
jgi:hypothetical protein